MTQRRGPSEPLRIGCVPYLNAKPLIDWFHTDECDTPAIVSYAVPSMLAKQLEAGEVDAALVSTFDLFRDSGLVVLPGVSISADGPVKSVRLFSHKPFEQITSVALDTSSLTSAALIQILLAERYGVHPEYISHPPNLDEMLQRCDAGLIIGDLKLFDVHDLYVMDLGAEWKQLTGLPFCYAAWLAREEAPLAELTSAFIRAKEWGEARLERLADRWSEQMALPLDRVLDYFQTVMRYGLGEGEREAVRRYHDLCLEHRLIREPAPLRLYDPALRDLTDV